MVRASAVAEKIGIRSVSLVASGFVRQAHAIAQAIGGENMAIAEYPGHPMIDTGEMLRSKVEVTVVKNVIAGLTTPLKDAVKPVEPGPHDIVFRGTVDEVQEFFYSNLWSEGLPIVPPTLEAVERFLRFADRSPDEVISVLLPENRQATIWNVAVNGVMAGCRPEYMPVLVAIVEAIADPQFRIEDAGSTPGWEPLIVINGPIVKELDFNCESGALRVGRQANTSIGRFLRLYMRNVAGLRIPPGATDKGSIAYTFNVALAENEEAVAEMGWRPFSVDRGFKAGESVVTVMSVVSITPPCYSGGTTPQEHLQAIGHIIGQNMAYKTASGCRQGKFFPLLVLSPSVAGVIARAGWTKDDARRYLYENVKAPAALLERLAWQQGMTSFKLCHAAREGLVSGDFCRSDDPSRLVPVFLRPDWINIVVSGDPGRNQSKGYVQNQNQAPPTSKRIVLPARRRELLAS
ncbi:MAG: hypothetical protein HYX92_11775 [Chloroflexi bacterium]|nr:hypothetical protein [Chloroflexota bacterium]